jgi:uncharacterized membrane protein YczE
MIVVSGVLLGSTIGLGTLFAIFLLGPMIQSCLAVLKQSKKNNLSYCEKKKQLSE